MENTKRKLQNRFEQWKATATQLISGPEEKEEATVLDLDPALLDKCQNQADKQQTTISAVINDILQMHWKQADPLHLQAITREQLERNPLLYLDGLSKRDFKQHGGDVYVETYTEQ
jgi:hypothetical protein